MKQRNLYREEIHSSKGRRLIAKKRHSPKSYSVEFTLRKDNLEVCTLKPYAIHGAQAASPAFVQFFEAKGNQIVKSI